MSDLDGSTDNLRIFSFVLSAEDVYRLPTVPRLPADVNADGIVDQADQDLVEANLRMEQLLP